MQTHQAQCEQPKYSQAIFPPEGVSKIATMINALVDMDYFTEEEEQEIFEHSVCLVLHEIEKALPEKVIRLILEVDNEDGVEDELAQTLYERLQEHVTRYVSLPYLDETDEARVISAVCKVIVESMKKGRQFDEVVEPVNSGELILDVFIKGSVGIFDSNNRKEFVDNIVVDLNIPFLPEGLKRWAVGLMLDAVGDVFESSIIMVYQDRINESYAWARERVADARASDDWEELLVLEPTVGWSWLWGRRGWRAQDIVAAGPKFASGRHFQNGQLLIPDRSGKATYGEAVRDKLVDELNERINVIGWVCDKFEEWEGLLIRKVVDLTLLAGMDLEKLETCIKYLCRVNFIFALHHEWYYCFLENNIRCTSSDCEAYYQELAREFTERDVSYMPSEKEEKKCRTQDASISEKKVESRRSGRQPS